MKLLYLLIMRAVGVPQKTFTFNLTNPTNGTISTAQGTGRITPP